MVKSRSRSSSIWQFGGCADGSSRFCELNDKKASDGQAALSDAIVKRIRAEKLIDQIFDVGGIPDRVWSAEACFEVMRKCSGAVLIGFPRWVSSERGKPVKLTTEFVHYEGVLAHAMQLPILTIKGGQVFREGR